MDPSSDLLARMTLGSATEATDKSEALPHISPRDGLSTEPVAPEPRLAREWLQGGVALIDDGLSQQRARVQSYNMWGLTCAVTTKVDLSWESRSPKLKRIFEEADADIVFLQETTAMMLADLVPWFATRGFSSVLPPDALMAGAGPKVLCVATFFRSSRWSQFIPPAGNNPTHLAEMLAAGRSDFLPGDLLADDSIMLHLEGCPVPYANAWPTADAAYAAFCHDWFWGRVADCRRPALITLLQDKASGGRTALAAVNVHMPAGSSGLRAGKGLNAVRTAMLVHAMHAAMRLVAGSHAKVHGVLAGDFNSGRFSTRSKVLRDEMGGFYSLLTTGELPVTHPDHPVSLNFDEKDGRGHVVRVVPGSVRALRLPLRFRSAYADVSTAAWPNNEAPWTAIGGDGDFKKTIDYIFVADAERPEALLPRPQRGASDWMPPRKTGLRRYTVYYNEKEFAATASAQRDLAREADAASLAAALARGDAALASAAAEPVAVNDVAAAVSVVAPAFAAGSSSPWFRPVRTMQALGVPSEADVKAVLAAELGVPWEAEHPVAPNAAMPSDHIDLVVDVE